jgi:opacity protein-like surface antigen
MKAKFKRLLCGVLAAVVLASSAPAASATVSAATSTKTATSATAEQEVSVKKPSKITYAAQKKKIKVAVKKVKGATGYQIQYATDKKMTKNKTTVTTKKVSYTVKGLKSGKTYYVRTRSYVKNDDGSKTYSKWSAVTKVKVK